MATDLLSSIASVVKKYRNVQKKDAEHAAEIIKTLGDSLQSFKFEEKNVQDIQNVVSALNTLNATFGQMTDNFFSTMFKFMPIKGKLMGKRIAKFYKKLIEGFESEKLDETMKKMRETFGESQNTASAVTAFGSILSALMMIDKRELLKFAMIFKMMPKDVGWNVNRFMWPIIDAFDHPMFQSDDKAKHLPIAAELFANTMQTLLAMDLKNVAVLHMLSEMGPTSGENIGGFILNIMDTIQQSKLSEEKNKLFGEFMQMMLTINVAEVLTLWAFSKMLTPEVGESIGKFFLNFINTISKVKKEQLETSEKVIKSVTNLIATLALSVALLVIVATQMKLEDIGCGAVMLLAVVAFSLGVMKVLSSDAFQKQTKDSMSAIKGIALLVLSLTAVLVITTMVANNFDGKTLWAGFGLMAGVLGLTLGLMWLLSSKKIQHMKTQSIKSIAGILLLIAGLALTLAVVTEISSKYDWKTLLKGMAVLGGVIAFSVLIMWTMSTDKVKKMQEVSFQTIGGLILMTLAMALIARLYIGIGDDWAKILKGTLAASAIMLAGLGLIWLGSKMDKKTVGKGLLAIGATILALAGIVLVTNYYMDLMDRIHGMDEGSITEGSLVVGAIVGGVGLIMMAAGALLFGPQAAVFALGFAALESISLAIVSISAACMSYTDLINKVNHDLTPTKLESATNMLAGDEGGMVGSIKKIVSSLLDIGAWSSIKIAIIAKALNPLFESLGNFVDVISKMANLQMVDYYDKEGKPVYKPMNSDDFKNASSVLTEGFTTFLTCLMGAFGLKDGKADPESATNGSLIWKCA